MLLLCYNQPLAHFLKTTCHRLAGKSQSAKHANDHVEVHSWESLLSQTLTTAGITHAAPLGSADRNRYYLNDVPAGIDLALASGKITPRFDALVVDEAQDHDTSSGNLLCGWWALYRALLKDPDSAPIAVAYDLSQRSLYVDSGCDRFSAERLRQWLLSSTTPAVQVHCPVPLRYTRQIATYLDGLGVGTNIEFKLTSAKIEKLPEGFLVEHYQESKPKLATKAAEIVARWIASGHAAAEEIVIIGAAHDDADLGLGKTLGGAPLVPYETRGKGQVAYLSAGRCKGIDARAVIVIGFYPFEKLDLSYKHSFALAVSRARQLLAVIGTRPATEAT